MDNTALLEATEQNPVSLEKIDPKKFRTVDEVKEYLSKLGDDASVKNTFDYYQPLCNNVPLLLAYIFDKNLLKVSVDREILNEIPQESYSKSELENMSVLRSNISYENFLGLINGEINEYVNKFDDKNEGELYRELLEYLSLSVIQHENGTINPERVHPLKTKYQNEFNELKGQQDISHYDQKLVNTTILYKAFMPVMLNLISKGFTAYDIAS